MFVKTLKPGQTLKIGDTAINVDQAIALLKKGQEVKAPMFRFWVERVTPNKLRLTLDVPDHIPVSVT